MTYDTQKERHALMKAEAGMMHLSQGRLRFARNHHKVAAGKDSSIKTSERAQPTPLFQTSAFEWVRTKISVVLSHLSVVICYNISRKWIHTLVPRKQYCCNLQRCQWLWNWRVGEAGRILRHMIEKS